MMPSVISMLLWLNDAINNSFQPGKTQTEVVAAKLIYIFVIRSRENCFESIKLVAKFLLWNHQDQRHIATPFCCQQKQCHRFLRNISRDLEEQKIHKSTAVCPRFKMLHQIITVKMLIQLALQTDFLATQPIPVRLVSV